MFHVSFKAMLWAAVTQKPARVIDLPGDISWSENGTDEENVRAQPLRMSYSKCSDNIIIRL